MKIGTLLKFDEVNKEPAVSIDIRKASPRIPEKSFSREARAGS
jgi:hypothetical protein